MTGFAFISCREVIENTMDADNKKKRCLTFHEIKKQVIENDDQIQIGEEEPDQSITVIPKSVYNISEEEAVAMIMPCVFEESDGEIYYGLKEKIEEIGEQVDEVEDRVEKINENIEEKMEKMGKQIQHLTLSETNYTSNWKK